MMGHHIKLFRECYGISPVVAIIFLVSITVVLIGILWVWSSEIATESSGTGSGPMVALKVERLDLATQITYKVRVVVIKNCDQPILLRDTTVSIMNRSGAIVPSYTVVLLDAMAGPYHGVQYFNVVNETPPRLSEGDYLLITDNGDGLEPEYTFQMRWAGHLLGSYKLPA